MTELQILHLICGTNFEDRHTTYQDLTYAYVRQLARISLWLQEDELLAFLAIAALLRKKAGRTFEVELEGNALPDFAREPRCNKCGR